MTRLRLVETLKMYNLPMANFEQLRYDKAVALSKRLKRNILPMAKFERLRYDKTASCRNAQIGIFCLWQNLNSCVIIKRVLWRGVRAV